MVEVRNARSVFCGNVVHWGISTICLLLALPTNAQVDPGGPGARPQQQRMRNRPRNQGKRPEFHPQRLFVRFQPGAAASARRAARANVNGRVRHQFRYLTGLEVLEVPPGRAEQALKALRNNPNVVYVARDPVLYVDQVPNDPQFSNLWGLQNVGQTVAGDTGTAGSDINVSPVWTVWTGDADFRVAVIDSGVDYTHPDLADNIWTNPGEIPDNGLDDDGNGWIDDVHGYDFLNEDADPSDDHGHGTHVSGTIAATGDNGAGVVGVNWQAKIVALKFIGAGGSGPTSDAMRALEYCIANNIKVSNNSYGGTSALQPFADLIVASQSVQHIFVAAAGNEATNIDVFPTYPAAYDAPNIITVAALDNDDQLAVFSNYGATSVDLGAPGVNILSTYLNGEYRFANGTSMAAPHVAGVTALIYSRFPTLTWAAARARLLGSVRPVDALVSRSVTEGAVNAFTAFGDCNANGIVDADELAAGAPDCTGNGILDECEPDCNGNGTTDSCEVFDGILPDCNGDGIPDECQPDCNNNATADVCEIAAGKLEDCNHNNIPDTCDFSAGGEDCNNNGILDSCDIGAGTSNDCDQNHVPDDCEIDVDCNNNGTPDWCDVIYGNSQDCNRDYVPDECETTPDCNGNGIGDEIELCYGWVFDCNHNGKPDECDFGTEAWVDCDENGVLDDCEFGVTIGLFHGDSTGTNMEVFPWTPPSPFLQSLRHAGYLLGPPFPMGRPIDVVVRHALPTWPSIDDDVFAGKTGMIFLDNWGGTPDFPASPIAPEGEILNSRQPTPRQGTHTLDPASPLVNGLPAYSKLDGVAMTSQLKPGVNTIVAWNDGLPMAATHQYGQGRVVYLNDLSGWIGTGLWPGDLDYGRKLFQNAVAFATPQTKDCNLNQVLDSCEIRDGLVGDTLPVGGDGIPDECQRDCNGNGVPDRVDVTSGSSADCDANGVPDECTGNMRDCNANGMPDACDIRNGVSPDCYGFTEAGFFGANGIPDECEADCDGNGVADTCDFVNGTHLDCDVDLTPDVCEPDADANGVPDRCEDAPRVLWIGFVGPNPLHDGILKHYPVNFERYPSPQWWPDPPPDLSVYDAIILSDRGTSNVEVEIDDAKIDEAVVSGTGLIYFLTDVAAGPIFAGQASPHEDIGPVGPLRFRPEVRLPSSPLVRGLPPASSMWSYIAPVVLRPGAEAVVAWGEPRDESEFPMAVTYRYGAGKVVWLNVEWLSSWPAITYNDRFFGTRLFRNALDYVLGTAIADCNGNGIEDEVDIAELSSADCDGDLVPDECQIDQTSTAPGGPFFCSINCDADCNDTGIPDACELTGNDIDANGVPDECDAHLATIPAASTWGLVILALGILVVGTLRIVSPEPITPES